MEYEKSLVEGDNNSKTYEIIIGYTEWYNNGQIKTEVNYIDGELDLKMEWYKNGQVKKEETSSEIYEWFKNSFVICDQF